MKYNSLFKLLGGVKSLQLTKEKIVLRHDRVIEFTHFNSLTDVTSYHKEMTYSNFLRSLQEPKISKQKGSAGGFIAGRVKNKRNKTNVHSRSMITLDIDDTTSIDIWDNVKNYTNFSILLYSSHNSTPDSPRYRLIIPLKYDIEPWLYKEVARFLVDLIQIEVDKTSYQFERLMFYPTCEDPSVYEFKYRDSPFFDPSSIVNQKKSIRSYMNGDFKKRDPRTKKNWIGAWCSVYSISDVLNNFLNDVYEPFSNDRYTYLPGSTKGGMVIYDDDTHAHSFHSTDIISGKNVNSFDLYRLHKFSHLDKETEKTKNDKPSYRAMIEFCKQDKRVKSFYEEHIQTQQNKNNRIIPYPYIIVNESLYAIKVIKEMEETNLVSRHVPIITKEFHNLERPQVLFEITWKQGKNKISEVVPASTIAVRKELLELSEKGFSVNENNVKPLIEFMDLYLLNNNIEKHYAVERLGNVKNNFIHPVVTKNINIIAVDQGERQILEGFEVKGLSKDWNLKVFELIKNYPKAVFFVLASFTSVIIKDLKVPPFIVDLAGSTSQGKTTTTKIATSVWGNDNLISEWNLTRVAVEMKAAYLNSYPLILDDTRKANEYILQDVIYQFSGGRSKGRGSIKGTRREYTWHNILLSNGEVPLTEYAKNAGGAAARVIPLVDSPLPNVDTVLLEKLYEGIENNYGAIGIDFLKIWLEHKKEFIPEYHKIKRRYMEKSKGNEVLTRLASYYSAVHFSGVILKKELGLDINLDEIEFLFNEISQENKSIDKPKQFLEEILTNLDSTRSMIYTKSSQNEPFETHAIYRNGILYLLPNYLSKMLGTEERLIRKEWLKRGMVVPTKNKDSYVDYKAIKHEGKTYRVIPLNMDYVRDLGFDFDETE